MNKIINPSLKELEEENNKNLYHTINYKTCKICGSKFKYGRQSLNVCGICSLEFNCNLCGKKSTIKLDNRNRIKSILNFLNSNKNLDEYEIYCSKQCAFRHNASMVSKESHLIRINKMKENGSYDKWQKSCHSKESRILAYQNMVINGNVNNLVKASNTKEVIKQKQKIRENNSKRKGFNSWSDEMNFLELDLNIQIISVVNVIQ